ncbi:L,D-transpeptidase [Pseudohoeflea suaedae]|uniref:L,D-transpeptidase n=1 Tax=Pseudohoeflea suaedae TaxID=877384 RepID=A0A4V3A725_9HYPH|nr:L,D-transpeptidase [Pseudohoeflea suaedae]TDH35812.1 L,D-transpeptidase [Pseudohoeflea suaedae]
MKKLLLAGAITVGMLMSATSAFAARIVANVDISSQTMTVTQNGVVKYRWKVSTGRKGYRTPTGTYSPKWLSKHHRSRKYNNAPMPYAVFFRGGYAIHGTNQVSRLGRPASHGCIRLHTANAATFFSMVERNGRSKIRIVINH